MSTVIYSVEHNSGPSWSREDFYVDGLASTETKALEIFTEKFPGAMRYAKGETDVFYAKSSINSDAERVFLCGADGWWWAIFKHEVE